MATSTMDAPPARDAAFHPGRADALGTSRQTPGWDLETERRTGDGRTLANALGWFSIGLGAYELLAPGHLARTLGMEGREDLVRVYGVREIGTGLGILANRRPAGWLWGRVAGDALDLATLAPAATPENPQQRNVGVAMAMVAGVMAMDVACALMLGRRYA